MKVQPVGRQAVAGLARPFDQHDPVVERHIETDLVQFIGAFDPVEIEMRDRAEVSLVRLHNGEGRAGHILDDARRAQEGAGEFGLAGAEIAPERKAVAGPGQYRQPAGKGLRRRQIRQGQGQAGQVRFRFQAGHADI